MQGVKVMRQMNSFSELQEGGDMRVVGGAVVMDIRQHDVGGGT